MVAMVSGTWRCCYARETWGVVAAGRIAAALRLYTCWSMQSDQQRTLFRWFSMHCRHRRRFAIDRPPSATAAASLSYLCLVGGIVATVRLASPRLTVAVAAAKPIKMSLCASERASDRASACIADRPTGRTTDDQCPAGCMLVVAGLRLRRRRRRRCETLPYRCCLLMRSENCLKIEQVCRC